MSQALPYHATGKPSYSARADRAQYAEDQCHVGSQTEARPPTDRSPPYGSPNPLRASRPKGQKWKEGNTYHFHVPGPTLPRNRQAGHSARASSTDGEDQNGEQRPPTHPRCSSHPNPPAHQEPLQASRPKGQFLKWLVVPGPTLPRNRPSQVTRQGQAQTDSEDPNGEQQTTLPTRVAQTTPTLQLIGSPSKPPVQRAT